MLCAGAACSDVHIYWHKRRRLGDHLQQPRSAGARTGLVRQTAQTGLLLPVCLIPSNPLMATQIQDCVHGFQPFGCAANVCSLECIR